MRRGVCGRIVFSARSDHQRPQGKGEGHYQDPHAGTGVQKQSVPACLPAAADPVSYTHLPESGKTAKGTNLVNILQVEPGERVQTMLHFRETGEEELYLFMVTRQGTVKRLAVSALKNIRASGIRALTLDEGDELVCVLETDGAQKILIATHDGMAVCFDEQDVRPMGRTAVGVRGLSLIHI